MQVIYEEIHGHAVWYGRQSKVPARIYPHIYGEGNLLSDAASRDYLGLLERVSLLLLGYRPDRVDIPEVAWGFLDRVLEKLRVVLAESDGMEAASRASVPTYDPTPLPS